MNANLTLAHKFFGLAMREQKKFGQAVARMDVTAAQSHHHKLNRIQNVMRYLASRYDRSK